MTKQKLELTWIGKGEEIKLEPRILIEDPGKSYGDPKSENMLIHGDNLLALKALEQDFAGKIKCIYIDPPYNTGNAFQHYDDNLEHSIWLNLIKPRIEVLRSLLSSDGFFCCQIDDSEGPYLKVLLDELFGRSNYLTTFYIQVRYANKTLSEDNAFQKLIEQCFVYAKDYTKCNPIKDLEEYKIEKFEWEIIELDKGEILELGRKKVELFRPGKYKINKIEASIKGLKETWATGSLIKQKASSGEFLDKYLAPRKELDGLGCLYKVYGIGEDGLGYRYFTGPKKTDATKGKFYSGVPLQRVEEILKGNTKKEIPIANYYDLSGNFGNCRTEGGADFRGGKKPEKLLEIIFKHFSKNDDWVLDSFIGSGSSCATAHKLGRKWIGIELGEHAYTHCLPRLKAIVDGSDKSGITEDISWKSGGGFKFYELAPSLLRKDKYSNWIIDEKYNANMLAAAMCKHESFKYFPDADIYWKQGKSTENDYIFVTTSFVTAEQIDKIHEEMKPDESLLICAKSFAPGCNNRHNTITIKKIPQMILGKCEYGKDNYDLNIINVSKEEETDEE
ncbi:MAG: site-specific DNA-methyltransferase [Elusimicrobia bacterium]|nr:site-specific DNA-methyltransferase [Elusimicrobiota bacterium]